MTDWTKAPWRKSTHSGAQQGCVEVAPVAGAVGVRDTTRREAGMFAVSPQRFGEFVRAVAARDGAL